jgi:FlaA1/EpsC-like NDP-sugar epimerase
MNSLIELVIQSVITGAGASIGSFLATKLFLRSIERVFLVPVKNKNKLVENKTRM